MGIITPDMRRVLDEQKLCFVATVCPDGTPNLSPKGTVAVLDDDHLVFANIRSPRTMANLERNPGVEINVVDHTVRKGYRFKGKASVLAAGAEFDRVMAFYRTRGTTNRYRQFVVIAVESAAALISPAYDMGASEHDVRERWEKHWDDLRRSNHEDSA